MGKGFGSPVSNWMVAPVHTVADTERLESVLGLLEAHNVSALPVVDRSGKMAGVITRTDLLKVGRPRADGAEHALSLPDGLVREHMTPTVEVVSGETSLEECARRMLKHHYHRLYVAHNGGLIGVVSTREMMEAVAAGGVKFPISDIMTPSIVSVRASEPISLALDRISAAHKSAVVVLDEQWPVGVFSQVEALACRAAAPGDAVERWMDLSILCLPHTLPCHRAAAQCAAVGARRIVVTDGPRVVGIVSGLDFARMVKAA